MTAPRLRTYKCRHCGGKLFSKACLECGTEDALPFIDVADPLATIPLPDPFPEAPALDTFSLPPFGGIDPIGGKNE